MHFPLKQCVLQDPLAAELGTGGATYAVQTDERFAGRRGCFFLWSLVCCLPVCCASTRGTYDHFNVLLLQASRAESAAADKEKMLAAMKEEAAVAKEQCKQLTQVNTKIFVRIEICGRGAGAGRTSSQPMLLC